MNKFVYIKRNNYYNELKKNNKLTSIRNKQIVESIQKQEELLYVFNTKLDTINTELEAIKTIDAKLEAIKAIDTKLEAIKAIDTKLEAIKAIDTKLEAIEIIDTKLEVIKTVDIKLDAIKTIDTKLEAIKVIDTKLEAIKAIDTKLEAIKTIDTKLEAIKALDTKLEAIKAINAKLDAVKTLNVNVCTLVNKINLDLTDNIFEFQNVRVYLPYYPLEIMSRRIIDNANFYEINILEKLNPYLNSDSVIFDIGANIGNHTLYWVLKSKVKRVYAFEPVKETYDNLVKNIELNNIQDLVILNNYALGDHQAKCKKLFYDLKNIGSTQLQESLDGDIEIRALDEINFEEEKVDLIKIDVEGFESAVLRGAKHFIAKYKPAIMIESFKENFDETHQILVEYQYHIEEKHDSKNYTYVYGDLS